jgi:hypothetical protein
MLRLSASGWALALGPRASAARSRTAASECEASRPCLTLIDRKQLGRSQASAGRQLHARRLPSTTPLPAHCPAPASSGAHAQRRPPRMAEAQVVLDVSIVAAKTEHPSVVSLAPDVALGVCVRGVRGRAAGQGAGGRRRSRCTGGRPTKRDRPRPSYLSCAGRGRAMRRATARARAFAMGARGRAASRQGSDAAPLTLSGLCTCRAGGRRYRRAAEQAGLRLAVTIRFLLL